VAFAGSADAAARHTWFYVDFAEAKCQLQPIHARAGCQRDGRRQDFSRQRAQGRRRNLTVMVKVKINGEPKLAVFFSSKDKCETTIKDTGLKPDQAPSDEIN
jgi:hypothetical protein